MEYTVTWNIDVQAESFEEAVNIALQIQRDPKSTATHFIVAAESGEVREIGLEIN